MKGKAPKSQELKKLAGTFRNDRDKSLNPNEALKRVPPAPSWLSDEAAQIFQEVCRELIGRKVLQESAVNLIAVYCSELYTYRIAAEKLKDPEAHVMTTATGYQQISPWITIRNAAQKNMRDIGALFGLDPVNRTRLPVKEVEEENPLVAILKKYKS